MSKEFKDSEFFKSEVVPKISLANLEQIRSWEESEATKVLKLYKRVRQELRDRLDSMPAGTFTAQRMQGTLLQIDMAIQEMNRVLAKSMKDSAGGASVEGIQDLEEEIQKFNEYFMGAVVPISLDATRIATDNANFLFNRYESSLQSYGQSLRAQFVIGLTEGIAQQSSWHEIVGQVSQTFMGEEWKLHRIVRTELHHVYNMAKIDGMRKVQQDTLPDLMKTLFHPMDSRTGQDSKWLNAHNPIVPVDQPFKEHSLGRWVEYMCPPNRPNDRAILIPYRKAWAR